MKRPFSQIVHFTDVADQKGHFSSGLRSSAVMVGSSLKEMVTIESVFFLETHLQKIFPLSFFYLFVLLVVLRGDFIALHLVIKSGLAYIQLLHGLRHIAPIFIKGIDDDIFLNAGDHIF